MKSISFTIPGNQDDPKGNPVAYTRSTQGGQWLPKVKKYREWKDHVREIFLAKCVDEKLITHADFRDLIYIHPDGKPIRFDGRKARMELSITYKDKTHADSDNVFKGIADALFHNDKYLSGSFDFDYALAGSVKVVIYFLDNEMAKPRRI